MGFIQPCYIYKNTESLRENLEKLGYKCNCKFDSNMLWIVGNNYFCSNQMLLNNREIGDLVFDKICCGTNEELFLAIAALRNDSDINQWFVYDNTDWENKEDLKEITFFLCKEKNVKSEMCCNLLYNDCRKATVEELIKHFTKE